MKAIDKIIAEYQNIWFLGYKEIGEKITELLKRADKIGYFVALIKISPNSVPTLQVIVERKENTKKKRKLGEEEIN